MNPARILAGRIQLTGKGLASRTVLPGSGIRPVIGVLDPAGRRVVEKGRFVESVEAAPIGCRIAAVNGPRVIEAIVATRNELRVEVSDVAVCIGIDRVVR